MKKVSLLILIIVIIGAVAFSQENDVRKLKWGMSYTEIKEIEGLGDSLFKQEELLGMKVEVVFGCGTKGLYSVTYSSKNPSFLKKASEVLNKKYGEPKKDLDYSFLLEAKEMLKQYPRAVVDIFFKNDYKELEKIESTYSKTDAKRIIRGGLTKRNKWEYGNTVALMLDNVSVAILSYRPKAHHYANKKKFNALMEELKKKVGEKKKTSKSEDVF
jgi:hypothetical protein